MYYTYVLKSLSTGRHYYGSTSDIDKRIKYHNSGKGVPQRHTVRGN